MMNDTPWPYNLPICRTAHRAVSPDGHFVAEIAAACEVSMGNPTSGTLQIHGQLSVERCNPSFVWSSDSRYLVVPQYFNRWFFSRRQRLLVIDLQQRQVWISRDFTWYFQPETFDEGRLVVTANPFHKPHTMIWHLPADLGRFTPSTQLFPWAAENRGAATLNIS